MKKSKLLSFLQFKKGIVLVLVLSFISLAAMAQNITVKGKVTDSKGEAVIGASVLVQGTTNGTVTDLDGNYSLTKVAPNAQLSFSYIGMFRCINCIFRNLRQ